MTICLCHGGICELSIRCSWPPASFSDVRSARTTPGVRQSGSACLFAQQMAKADIDEVKKFMKMVEILTEPDKSMPQGRRVDLRSTMYNNLTCLSKKEGKHRIALQYAHRALKLQAKHGLTEGQVASLLNIAALNSDLGKHELALKTAESALDKVLDLEEQRFQRDIVVMETAPLPQARDKIYYAPLQVTGVLGPMDVTQGCSGRWNNGEGWPRGGNKSDPHFSAFFRIFSRIFSPARSLLTKEEMHCTFVLVYWCHPPSDW